MNIVPVDPPQFGPIPRMGRGVVWADLVAGIESDQRERDANGGVLPFPRSPWFNYSKVKSSE